MKFQKMYRYNFLQKGRIRVSVPNPDPIPTSPKVPDPNQDIHNTLADTSKAFYPKADV